MLPILKVTVAPIPGFRDFVGEPAPSALDSRHPKILLLCPPFQSSKSSQQHMSRPDPCDAGRRQPRGSRIRHHWCPAPRCGLSKTIYPIIMKLPFFLHSPVRSRRDVARTSQHFPIWVCLNIPQDIVVLVLGRLKGGHPRSLSGNL